MELVLPVYIKMNENRGYFMVYGDFILVLIEEILKRLLTSEHSRKSKQMLLCLLKVVLQIYLIFCCKLAAGASLSNASNSITYFVSYNFVINNVSPLNGLTYAILLL